MKLEAYVVVANLLVFLTTGQGQIRSPRSMAKLAGNRNQRRLVQNTQAPSVSYALSKECVDEAGSGGDEAFTLSLTIEGAGGTTTSRT